MDNQTRDIDKQGGSDRGSESRSYPSGKLVASDNGIEEWEIMSHVRCRGHRKSRDSCYCTIKVSQWNIRMRGRTHSLRRAKDRS